MARIAFRKAAQRTLGALAVLVAATGVVIGSGANFTASSANPNNSFAAGSLSILNDKENAAILTATDMVPGGTPPPARRHPERRLAAGMFTLSRSAPVDSDAGNPLSAKLNLVVKDCGVWPDEARRALRRRRRHDRSTARRPTIAGMSSPVALGTFAAAEKHRYEFCVQLDASATDAYQGDTSSVQFNWNAVQ